MSSKQHKIITQVPFQCNVIILLNKKTSFSGRRKKILSGFHNSANTMSLSYKNCDPVLEQKSSFCCVLSSRRLHLNYKLKNIIQKAHFLMLKKKAK